MICRIEDIVRRVRVALDENCRSEALILEGDPDTLGLDEIIRSKVEPAARMVVRDAPLSLLAGSGRALRGGVSRDDMGRGRMRLPDDFLRLMVLRMPGWDRPLYSAYTAVDAEAELMYSRYSGIRGSRQKPMAVLSIRGDGQGLEYSPCVESGEEPIVGLYLPMPSVDEDGGIEIPERCVTAIVLMAGALTLQAIGQNEPAQFLIQLSKDSLV